MCAAGSTRLSEMKPNRGGVPRVTTPAESAHLTKTEQAETVLLMKKQPRPKPASQGIKVTPATKRIGGQPENDEDARAAGWKSATADENLAPPPSAQANKRRKR